MKVLKNNNFGGFSLSSEAYEWLVKNKKIPFLDIDVGKMYHDEVKKVVKDKFGKEIVCIYKSENSIISKELRDKLGISAYSFALHDEYDKEIRTHKGIIECFETIGSEKFNGRCSSAVIVEIPDDVDWEIDEYDGLETIKEKHRTW